MNVAAATDACSATRNPAAADTGNTDTGNTDTDPIDAGTIDTGTIDTARLGQLAEVIVRVGLNLQPGQDLVLTAGTGALPLVRRVVAQAYKAGAGLVTPLLNDDETTLARHAHSTAPGLDRAPGWLYDGMARAFGAGAAWLVIEGGNPMLLAGQDPGGVARASMANAMAYRPAQQPISDFNINWCAAAYPGTAWARQVFPDRDAASAVRGLADAIFAASRINGGDAVAAWAAHAAALRLRSAALNARRFDALRFTGPGTDLTVGLADGHAWLGGATTAQNGVTCLPNIPTEEVFTTPHALRVSGHVSATKPLSHQGSLIEGIRVTFEAGRITGAHASKGEAVLHKVLESDAGARRLGEVALVPHSSPISASGLLFFNTLFDENAACHIALGQCYSKGFLDGTGLSPDQIAAQGGNSSMIHIDWMIGSGEVDVDGIGPDGTVTAVMRKGEWV